jgi:isoleucyl-tRNA synthetase
VLDAIGVRRAARSLATKTVNEQMKAFREWGVMADWDSRWTTMDKVFETKQLGVFQEMAKKGLIFRRYKPVYWSPSSRTALAEAELEYKEDHLSMAAYVKFLVTNVPEGLKGMLPDGQLYAVIWTTTPWTLPANRAIAVHHDLEYSVIRSGSDLLLIASTRLKHLTKLFVGETPVDVVVESIKGTDLVGAQYVNVLLHLNLWFTQILSPLTLALALFTWLLDMAWKTTRSVPLWV